MGIIDGSSPLGTNLLRAVPARGCRAILLNPSDGSKPPPYEITLPYGWALVHPPAMKWTGIWRPARAESPKQQSRLVRGNRIENGVGSEVY